MNIEVPTVSNDVLAFCTKHGIIDEARRAVELVEFAFPQSSKITLEVQEDYESEDSWLVIRIWVQLTVDQAHEKFRECMLAWYNEIHWPASGLLRLLYHFA